jgi:hypothetical protein
VRELGFNKYIMSKSEYIRLNIALISPININQQAIKISRDIGSRFATSFILDNEIYHPHLTVYSPEFPSKNVDKIFAAIQFVIEKHQPLTCQPIKINSHYGFIDVEIELSKQIRDFHEEIVKTLNPLRENYLKDKYSQLDNNNHSYSPELVKNIKEYGHPRVLKTYRPHLTLTHLPDEQQALKVAKSLDWDMYPFIIGQVGVFTMGTLGTCRELLKKFGLKAEK